MDPDDGGDANDLVNILLMTIMQCEKEQSS